jgi:hypothetical protein
MRVTSDSSLSLQNRSLDKELNDGKTKADEVAKPSKSSADKTQESQKKEKQEYKEARETYGLDTIRRMSDEEYAAFARATANMSPNEKIQAAQSLHLVAKSYQEAQKAISGGGMVDALNGNSGFFKNDPAILDSGIKVLSQMNNGNSKEMAGFLSRFRGALASNGLNLSA